MPANSSAAVLVPEPTQVDEWRCPLCSGAARPYNLVVDGFLVQVRERLAREGRLGVKSVVVNPDGSWTPAAEDYDSGRGLTPRGVIEID